MPDHTGRRRKQDGPPLSRLAVLIVALAAVGFLVTLPEPEHVTTADRPLDAPAAMAGPEPVATAGRLSDGAPYTPRLFLTAGTSVGTAPTPKGDAIRLVRVAGTVTTELRRLAAEDQPQFNGFAASGDTLVWAEATAPDGAGVRTSLWRVNWRTGKKPSAVTSATGEPDFYGGQFDLVVHGGRIFWASLTGDDGVTEVRSVSLGGGAASTKRLTGDYALSAWPWAVTVNGGRGRPVQLVNYDSNAKVSFVTDAQETAVCDPSWCRVGVFEGDSLARIEVVKPDGTGRRRVAGDEATPTIADVALLDRFVPLTTDRGQAAELSGVGLSLYDLTTGQTDLIATDVADVRGSGPMLWWSTTEGDVLTWSCIDLRGWV